MEKKKKNNLYIEGKSYATYGIYSARMHEESQSPSNMNDCI